MIEGQGGCFPRPCHTGSTCPFICLFYSLCGLSRSNRRFSFFRYASRLNVLQIEFQCCNQNADDNDDKSDDNRRGKRVPGSFMFLWLPASRRPFISDSCAISGNFAGHSLKGEVPRVVYITGVSTVTFESFPVDFNRANFSCPGPPMFSRGFQHHGKFKFY